MLRKKGRKQERKEGGRNCFLSVVSSGYKIHSLNSCKSYLFLSDLLFPPLVCCLGYLRVFPRVLYFFILFLISKENEHPVAQSTSKYLTTIMHLKKLMATFVQKCIPLTKLFINLLCGPNKPAEMSSSNAG
jgi:hypothetical protein